jgi:hypothetical protein
MNEPASDASPRSITPRDWIALAAILLLATGLRVHHLGWPSLWYDEVVSMRLARTAGPVSLMRLLETIDATRAPLHPLLLQAWLKLCGPSDVAGRSLSVACGISTVALVFWVGCSAFDTSTGLWGAWLSAWSPLLVRYSQEARMYAWLVLVTCLAWGLLLSFRRSASDMKVALYVLVVAVLVYSHPLGLLMAAALALASLLNGRALNLPRKTWIAIHVAIALVVGPWLPCYFNHPPEYVVGRLPVRFLIGLPIGFIGGNRFSLLVTLAVIAFGLAGTRAGEPVHRRLAIEYPVAASCLLIWLMLPPVLLYAYSQLAHPIFGPARYTLFVGPAYLLLVARGLSKLALAVRLGLAAADVGLSASLLATLVYAPDIKADWRAAAVFLDQHAPGAPVVVLVTDPVDSVSVETARYYFGSRRQVIAMPARWDDRPPSAWYSVALRDGKPVGRLPEPLQKAQREGQVVDLPGLRLIRP